MALPAPPDHTTPIPNNPFFSPESYIVQGAYYPMIVGSGISVSANGTISSTGGGGAISSITGGAGILVAPTTGNVVVTNTGVTDLTAGSGITISGSTGSITISSTGTGTVTSVSTGTGLTGGPIVNSGTIALANTGVAAGTYTNPSIIVNAQGQITSASSGTAVTVVTGTAPIAVTAGTTPVVSIAAATTTNSGAVQLSDSTTSVSSTVAATALAVKTAYDAAIVAIPKSCLIAKGGLVTASAAAVPLALPVGADGEILTADSACSGGLKWAAGSGGVSGTFTFGTCTVVITNGLITLVT